MTTYIKASCHCGASAFQAPFKTSSLPKQGALCHCNICRHSTGQMAYMCLGLDGKPLSIDSTPEAPVTASLEGLGVYKSSSIGERYFCKTCSANLLFHYHTADQDGWSVLPGVLERLDGVVEFSEHIFVEDTLDGGLADHFRRVGDKTLARFKTWSDENGTGEAPVGWKDPSLATLGNDASKLPFYCACKAVQFYLTRPSKPSDDPAVYWVVPGSSPSDPIRFIYAHCLCNSCRLTAGNPIQTWAIVSNEHIFDAATDAPLDLADPNKRPKGLKQYQATPGKYREFCGTCGATAFWWTATKEGEHPHTDVAVGLVDQVVGGGARAEGWLSFYPRIIHKDFSLSSDIAKALEDGLKTEESS